MDANKLGAAGILPHYLRHITWLVMRFKSGCLRKYGRLWVYLKLLVINVIRVVCELPRPCSLG